MSEEGEDYMSDEFLQSCLNSAQSERPGLIKSRKEQREHDMMLKKIASSKEKKKEAGEDADAKKLEESLKAPIGPDNKGFSMLQKMGFKTGMGLGKMNSGIVEPIPISVKNDRQGLGRAEALRQIKLHKERIKQKRKEKMTNVDDYRAIISKKCKEREVASDLRKSKRICHQLDLQAGVDKPEDEWFWPVDCIDQPEKTEDGTPDQDENDEEFELSEKLEILTSYLRNTYCYCIWCGLQYADEKDLQDCPGPTRELH